MTFPDYQTWLDSVVHPRERIATRNSPWCFEHPDWYRHYRGKHDLALALRPASILEIGVRYGYSAHAFLSAVPGASYVGIDSNDPAHNAMGEPTLGWALAMLNAVLDRTGTTDGQEGPPDVTLHVVNTREKDLRRLFEIVDKGSIFRKPGPPAYAQFDLVHIDADHSYHGALDDMTKAWDVCGRAMLVDDYAACASVHDAVDAFVRQAGATMLASPSKLGEALVLRGA